MEVLERKVVLFGADITGGAAQGAPRSAVTQQALVRTLVEVRSGATDAPAPVRDEVRRACGHDRPGPRHLRSGRKVWVVGVLRDERQAQREGADVRRVDEDLIHPWRQREDGLIVHLTIGPIAEERLKLPRPVIAIAVREIVVDAQPVDVACDEAHSHPAAAVGRRNHVHRLIRRARDLVAAEPADSRRQVTVSRVAVLGCPHALTGDDGGRH